MSHAATGAAAVSEFACQGCGRTFKWKPSIAGRAAKCGCGAVLTVPTDDPRLAVHGETTPIDLGFGPVAVKSELQAAVARHPAPVLPIESEDHSAGDFADPAGGVFDVIEAQAEAPPPLPVRDDLDLAPAPVKKGKKGTSGQSAATTRSNRTGERTIGYAAKPALTERGSARDENVSLWGGREERRPALILAGVGSAIFIGAMVYWYGNNPTMFGLGMGLALMQVVAMTLAAFAVSAVAGISFGVLGLAVLRFAAVLMCCEAVHVAFNFADIPFSGMLRMSVVMATFWFLSMWMFSLEFDEVRILGFVYFVIKAAFTFLIIGLVMSMA